VHERITAYRFTIKHMPAPNVFSTTYSGFTVKHMALTIKHMACADAILHISRFVPLVYGHLWKTRQFPYGGFMEIHGIKTMVYGGAAAGWIRDSTPVCA
jgi:hypothetical protein